MRTVIGLVGEIGSGKGTFVEILKKITSSAKIAHIKSSQILGETLDLWGVPKTRINLQDMAIIMDNHFGKGTLSQAVKNRINSSSLEIVIYDGVRWQSDVDMIRSFPKNILLYITADQKIRFKRIKARGEYLGEKTTSLAQFKKEAAKDTEVSIKVISRQADIKLENNGTVSEFSKKIATVVQEYLSH